MTSYKEFLRIFDLVPEAAKFKDGDMRERLKKVVEHKSEFDFMVKTYKRDIPEIH